MNNHYENERLLRDVVGEGPFTARRAALLEETLRHARRRRLFRQARRGACVLAIAALAVLLVNTRRQVPTQASREIPKPKPYRLVETQPFRPAALVKSGSLSTGNVISTVPMAGVITTAATKFQLKEVSDDALLALTAPNPAILVRRADGKAELVFVNSNPPDDTPE